jgi:hypothetical protein
MSKKKIWLLVVEEFVWHCSCYYWLNDYQVAKQNFDSPPHGGGANHQFH